SRPVRKHYAGLWRWRLSSHVLEHTSSVYSLEPSVAHVCSCANGKEKANSDGIRLFGPSNLIHAQSARRGDCPNSAHEFDEIISTMRMASMRGRGNAASRRTWILLTAPLSRNHERLRSFDLQNQLARLPHQFADMLTFGNSLSRVTAVLECILVASR